MTYAQLEDRSTRFARALRSRGLDGRRSRRHPHGATTTSSWRWRGRPSAAGLHYTAINSHLRPARCSTCWTTAAPRRWCRRRRLADVVAGLDLSPHTGAGLRRAANSPASSATTTSRRRGLGDRSTDECEGREMLVLLGDYRLARRAYVSRCPARRSAIQRRCPSRSRSASPLVGGGPSSVYLCPAPLYHSAPLVGSMSCTGSAPRSW